MLNKQITAVNASSSATKESKKVLQQDWSNNEIGRVAGAIWELLSEKDAQSLAAIKKAMDVHADIVVAALGWLAREGKLDFTSSGRRAKFRLHK